MSPKLTFLAAATLTVISPEFLSPGITWVSNLSPLLLLTIWIYSPSIILDASIRFLSIVILPI